jgi:hypothetical protein
MISFSNAAKLEKRDKRIEFAPVPSNQKVISLWHKAKDWALEFGRTGDIDRMPTRSDDSLPLRSQTTESFMQKLNRERENLVKRKTVVINPSSMETLLAIAAAGASPFASKDGVEKIDEESEGGSSAADVSERESLNSEAPDSVLSPRSSSRSSYSSDDS